MGERIGARGRGWALTLAVPLAGGLVAGCGEAGQGGGTGASDSCYDGKRLSFVVAYGEGGGFDIFARTLAPYLEEELGATVVVENRPGAGGLTAANEIYAAEPDGLTVGFFSGQGLTGAVLGGSSGAQFDLEKFTYIARLAQDDRVLVTGPNGETDIGKLQEADGLSFASAGPGGSDHVDATVLIPVLGLDAEIVTGYKGSAETGLAVTTGDTDLASGTVPSRMDAMRSGDLAPVLILAEDRNDEFPDTPALLELDLDDEQRALAEAHTELQSTGFVVLAPPAVPENCTEELRGAYEASLADEKFVADMEEQYQPVEYTSGDELKEIVQAALDAPEEYRTLLESAYANQ